MEGCFINDTRINNNYTNCRPISFIQIIFKTQSNMTRPQNSMLKTAHHDQLSLFLKCNFSEMLPINTM